MSKYDISGVVVFFDPDGNLLNAVTVGALPDMVTFTPDSDKLLVANEGEPGLVDETDRLRAGDEVGGKYPILSTDADGNPIAIVNTDGNYKYVGRLVVDFDENGVIIPESIDARVSGAYATDDAGVAAVGGEGLEDPEIVEITNSLAAEIAQGDRISS